MRHDAWVGTLSWWSSPSPVAHSCGLLNHLNSFCGGMFKLNAKFDADSLLYLLSHFECNGHTVHMLTQWHLPPPLTSTVKLSLLMHEHSSPLSLAAHCCANHSVILKWLDFFWTETINSTVFLISKLYIKGNILYYTILLLTLFFLHWSTGIHFILSFLTVTKYFAVLIYNTLFILSSTIEHLVHVIVYYENTKINIKCLLTHLCMDFSVQRWNC